MLKRKKPYKLILYGYKPGLSSTRHLLEAFRSRGIRIGRINPETSCLVVPNATLINWGCRNLPNIPNVARVINPSDKVANAANKIRTFELFSQHEVPTVEWTINASDAAEWLGTEGTIILARTLSDSSKGRGILVVRHGDSLPTSPLYTKYKRKKFEYRVHVFMGEIIDVVQKKARNNKPENFTTLVRSYDNGWIFSRNLDYFPDDLLVVGLNAVDALGLDFGAVDIIWNEKQDKCFALEVNTAPGIEGTTVENYVEAITTCLL